jgi:hypothetical protein
MKNGGLHPPYEIRDHAKGDSTMLASTRPNQGKRERRGIVLVLILGVLALMAVIGVAFATFSGQSRISARNFAQAVNQPQSDELMDYALEQLIGDTADIRSSIRGHSMARDMYGNDGNFNGYVPSRPGGADTTHPLYNYSAFYIVSVASAGGTLYNLTTNIPSNDPALYGYYFTRWTLRVTYNGNATLTNGGTGVIAQTLEVLADSGYVAGAPATSYRTFTVNIGYTEGNFAAAQVGPPPVPAILPTTLNNPTGAGYTTQLPGQYFVAAAGGTLSGTWQFILDGRWLHAFNGPGMTSNAVEANFRYNQLNPNTTGMDEDYDAVDLENWFLAMQSADGSVIIPSFHRPAVVRYDPANKTSDWSRDVTNGWTFDMARILRPVAADGHDATTFPDLVPGANGRITYDVDNDGDGQTDSVWVDLGYPARRNAQGQLYKPLFAFMVIGLNGRIPLNTAGNLAGGGPGSGGTHAAHLGNSVSEIDPTYGLQNGFVFANDAVGAFTNPIYGTLPYPAFDTQVDSGGIDVRLTQLRNLLTGTRPQTNPGVPGLTPGAPDLTGQVNGDNNFVAMGGNFLGLGGEAYYMPNSIADTGDVDMNGTSPPAAGVLRITPAVAGRWGESQAVPGYPVYNPNGPPFNLVMPTFNNGIRAGYSIDVTDLVNGTRDAADDNYNSFDPYFPGHTGEVGDLDFLDLAGAYLLPVERMRRYVTPVDINGTGRIVQYNPSGYVFTGTLTIGSPSVTGISNTTGLVAGETIVGTGIPDGTTIMTVSANTITLSANATVNGPQSLTTTLGPNIGGDQWGRVEFSSYFRPPGLPGQVPPTPPGGALTTGVTFPWISTESYPNTLVTNVTTGALAGTLLNNNNPLHGFEAQRFPNLNYPTPPPYSFTPQRVGGVPVDLNWLPGNLLLPGALPTYDVHINGSPNTNSDGLNEADEMNLYQPNAQLDSPFGYGDLEWLYRQQDVDGGSLTSRLAQLAPVSFSNPIDGLRRRRLFALDSWEMNNFAWTNDNPGNAFPNNTNFSPSFTGTLTSGLNAVTGISSTAGLFPGQTVGGTGIVPGTTIVSVAAGGITLSTNATVTGTEQLNVLNQNAGFVQLGVNRNTMIPTPSLAQRDKKINLNYPLPVSNDPNEAVRQKWISDTYQTLKGILPPRAVDTAEELAQLSQFVINIIDFRDTDATMTHWRNPDVFLHLSTGGASPYLIMKTTAGASDVPLDQYGMEYNPIAINEVMAYSFQGSSGQTNRFFMELVNVLTSPELGTTTNAGLGTPLNNASVLDLAGFQSGGTPAPTTPWDGGCWDVVFTGDDPASRPDPITGQLWGGGTFYGLIPLCQAAFQNATTDPVIYPLPQAPDVSTLSLKNNVIPQTYFKGDSTLTPVLPPANPYFLTIGNTMTTPSETAPYTPYLPLANTYDPVSGAPPTTLPPAGVLPGVTPTPPTGTAPQILPKPTMNSGQGTYYWICLRRPANPFAGVSLTNPMIVVDCMRFPYIEAGSATTPSNLFSYQRLQPFRGGHAVPMPNATGTNVLDPRYGYTEQIAVPATPEGYVQFNGTTNSTLPLLHTLGLANDGTLNLVPYSSTSVTAPYLNEPWDYFPFNDRDFTSVAELLMVPGCPPGLFTKQFAEFAPSSANVTSVFSRVKPPTTILAAPVNVPAPPANASTTFITGSLSFPVTPHTFPYLVDKFFYTGANYTPPTPPPATSSLFGDPTGDGWFKMFEFFEVPSQMIGAVGPVAQGANFDWLRQDTKPGLINLNLIIDEEVFFSVFGSQQHTSFNTPANPLYEQLLSFDQLPNLLTFSGGQWATLPAGTSPIPEVVTATLASGAPAYAYPMNNVGVLAPDRLSASALGNRMKASFAQFLSLRHGGSGFVFGYGSGATGQNTVVPTGNPNAPAAPNNPIPADRPFHSLSYPDINYTIMRPAALPPSLYTDPKLPTPPPTSPPLTAAWPPTSYPGTLVGDPGVRNPLIYEGYLTAASASPVGTTPASTPASQLLVPPAIPVRRLFQPPDASPPPSPTPLPIWSNASEQGDTYINNTAPTAASVATGGLPPYLVPQTVGGTTYSVNDNYVNLFWVPGGPAPPQPPTTPTVLSPYLGVNSVAGKTATPPANATPPLIDMKQHPYFRTEMLQKAMNLTTVRTHQYAVWITIGFFEVTRQGDPLMANAGAGTPAAALAFDILGPEIGASTGQTTRFRGFFLVDRTKLYGFDDTTPGSFQPAVVYRQTIE